MTHCTSLLSRRQALASTIVAASGMVSDCALADPTYRYRLRVYVTTPLGEKLGSTVLEVKTAYHRGLLGAQVTGRSRGEAAIVQLPRGPLFALIRNKVGEDMSAAFAQVAIDPKPPADPVSDEVVRERVRRIKTNHAEVEVPHWIPSHFGTPGERINCYPTFVTFRDLADPNTIVEVDPDNLAEYYGPGTFLKRITVQITRDAFEKRVRQELPWLPRHAESRIVPGNEARVWGDISTVTAAHFESKSWL